MQKQKGFTIIELIVVIAIIAVLAAIVLVNVTQYIARSHDAAIQADMNSIRTSAAAFMADPDKAGTYTAFVATVDYTTPEAAIEAANGASSDVTENVLDGSYCLSSPLASDSNKHWCVDSANFAGLGTCGEASSVDSCTAE